MSTELKKTPEEVKEFDLDFLEAELDRISKDIIGLKSSLALHRKGNKIIVHSEVYNANGELVSKRTF